MRRNSVSILLLAFMVCAGATQPAPTSLSFSAKVDKTSVNVGDPLVLTITLGGDVSGIDIPVFEFPEGFAVASRSQSSNFSLRLGTVERSLTLAYVLLPQQGGTFQLGPFQIAQKDQKFSTEPITVTVEKPAVPPRLGPEGGRFTL